MPNELKGFYKVGGTAFIVSGTLFFVIGLLDLTAGPPPSNGVAILAWTAAHPRVLPWVSEVLFFATIFLVPAVIALYHQLANIDRVKAATGCGILAAVIPVLAVLLIVHGRLIYPIYGIRVSTPEVAELVIAVYYGGLHAVLLLLAGATIVLSLAMNRGTYGKPVVYLGFVTAVLDIIGSYPWAIGPVPTLICQVFFAAWFVAVGARLYRMEG